ncbi:transcription initiation factor TFIID subunit 12-like [Hetaerina americana]|uniref:transcription initiation factor TFIID subunit 12-like n=1 Tax=Hetaerina americana TaxID=62018 RepID=UPI003A7F26B0
MTSNLTGNLGQSHNVSTLVGGGSQSTPLILHHPINLGASSGGQVPHAKLPQSSPATSAAVSSSNTGNETQMLTRSRLQDLVREVDPSEQLDEEVEEVLLQLADDFVESAVGAACLLAKHRRATTIDVRDVQLHLERNLNMWIPGFGTDELRPYKRAVVTEAHKQRLALIRKALKKY